MPSVRDLLLKHFPSGPLSNDPEAELAAALCSLLWSIEDHSTCVDGWEYCHVLRESDESISAVGLMSLLPSGAIPIEVEVRGGTAGLVWSAKTGQADASWTGLSSSGQWKSVYSYATNGRVDMRWEWGREYSGSVPDTGA